MQAGTGLRSELDRLIDASAELDLPEIDAELAAALGAERDHLTAAALAERRGRVVNHLQAAKRDLDTWVEGAISVSEAADERERALQAQVERALAERGFEADRLKEFQALNRRASLLASYEAHLKECRTRLAEAENMFSRMQVERSNLVRDQRTAFDSVMESIRTEFGGRIRASRLDCGESGPLARFLHDLARRGISRWWNGIVGALPSPQQLAEALDGDDLGALGMSEAVQKTFRETITTAKRRELEGLRCPDRYRLELRLDDGSYRPLDQLSGGQRVSVLLSLLLETSDERPLVIDQPEDELDNRFLLETVLPALKKLKGRRQVIVATHNANIVVNGDADMVIQLEATANRGRVAVAGAIEEPAVRDAIVRTVDGGAQAFRLRRLKYGFLRRAVEWLEILERIEAGEDHRTEFKRGASDLQPIGRAICAFANTEGGVLVLGVDDTGMIAGVAEDAKRIQERLTSFLQSGCSAPVSARLGHHRDRNGWVHWIEVAPTAGLRAARLQATGLGATRAKQRPSRRPPSSRSSTTPSGTS